jgi:hypothetical protein
MAVVVLGGGVASAVPFTPGTWTVSPGGTFRGTAGTTILAINNGTQLTCRSSTVNAGTLVTSATGSPATLGTLPQGSVRFANCSGPFGLTFNVTHIGTWGLKGVTYDPATGVTRGVIDNISSRQLAVLGGFTLTVTAVSPTASCLNLIHVGDTASFTGTYTADPLTPQTITAVP